MIADDKEIARKITAYLSAGSRDLKSGTLYRLQQARAAALARVQDPMRAPASELAGGGGTLGGHRPFYAQVRIWVGVALIAFAGFGWQQWQAYQTIKEAEEIDAQLLTSDLPIDAYLDRGFQAWLRTAAQR
ncbi:hypothetical protein BURK1_01353 [Burkholderiales bacterium]|nr:hypothetical protein BURK1_01353 [Burkholderiales bacterium]